MQVLCKLRKVAFLLGVGNGTRQPSMEGLVTPGVGKETNGDAFVWSNK